MSQRFEARRKHKSHSNAYVMNKDIIQIKQKDKYNTKNPEKLRSTINTVGKFSSDKKYEECAL